MIKIIQRRKVWFALSSFLTIVSIFALASWGLRLGIDYTGGSMMEVSFNENKLESQDITDVFNELDLGEAKVQFSGDNDAFLRFKEVDETTHQSILTALNKKTADKAGANTETGAAETAETPAEDAAAEPIQVETQNSEGEDVTIKAEDAAIVSAADEKKYVSEKSFDSIGPVVGSELQTTTVWAILLAIIGIITYIAWAFRKVSYPVSSFKYGLCATIALSHDIIITAGVFSVLGHLYGVEIGATFLAAALAILGYSYLIAPVKIFCVAR
jgi:preprotein translocase subunit SecF